MKNYLVECEAAGDEPDKYTVEKLPDDGMVVKRVFDRKGFKQELRLDGYSNATLTYEHGGGKGEIKIPCGEIFDIPLMMVLMNLHPEGNIAGEHRIYEELAGTLYEKKK
mgnify:CR=1